MAQQVEWLTAELNELKTFLQVIKALSNSGRVKILKVLQKKALCVSEIQSTLGLSQPAVSKHLAVLEAAGLVDRQKQSLWVYYGISDGSDSPYAATLLGNLRHWFEDRPDVAALTERARALSELKKPKYSMHT